MSSMPNRFLLYKMANKDRILQEAIRVTGEQNPSKQDLIRAASRCWAAEPQCKKEEWKLQRKPQQAAERSGKVNPGASRDLHAREAGEDHELSQKERIIEVDEAYGEGEVIRPNETLPPQLPSVCTSTATTPSSSSSLGTWYDSDMESDGDAESDVIVDSTIYAPVCLSVVRE